jgi:5S rRNA maturation endonuclease (ribonuclease M5)
MPDGTTETGSFILGQLEAAAIPYEVQRDFIHVHCPFHQHSGQKMKLGFSRTSGGMHCWVCKKKGHWNEYAELKRLQGFAVNDPRLQDFEALKRQFDELLVEKPVTSPEWLEPWRGRWRGLDGDFLRSIPSYIWLDEASGGKRILWPCYMDGQFRGCMAARLHPDTWPKTRNLVGMDATRILFPFDHPLVRESRSVCLVEGQFDALRLLSRGVPTVSIMGTGNWNVHKLNRLAARGVERIVLCMDGDVAGELAQDEIAEAARNRFDVRTVPLPNPSPEEQARGIESLDPGNCDERYLRLIGRLVRS